MIIRNLEDSVSNYLGFFMPIMPPQARLHASGESQDKDGEAGGGGWGPVGAGCAVPNSTRGFDTLELSVGLSECETPS